MDNVNEMLVSRPSDFRSAVAEDPGGLPFRVELSLAPLVRFWGEAFSEDGSARAGLAAIMRREVETAPELGGPITDLGVLTRRPELISALMTAVFAPAFWSQEIGAALVPFQLRSFYATPTFRRLLMTDDGFLRGRVNADEALVRRVRRLFAYRQILRRIYQIDIDVDVTIIVTAPDPETGLDRHFKIEFDPRFLDVDTVGTAPELDESARARLAARVVDADELATLLPPETFVLRGFTVLRAVEVTDQEVLSSIKRDLIDKESIVSASRFEVLQAKLRTFFRRPELRFGLAAIDGDRVLVLTSAARLEHACIFADSAHLTTSDFAGSLYERAVHQRTPVIVRDLTERSGRTRVEEEMIRAGARNLLIAPLRYQDRVIGTLNLASPNPGDLNAAHLPKLQEVLPLFAMAVQRSLDELGNRVQAFIKEKATAIHPVVEWRFRRAVLDALERRREDPADGALDLPPIVFEKVQPLYALSDIRGSSTQRALAIQADLLTQLRLARAVVDAASRARRLPALDELLYRLDKHAARITESLASGDEVEVVGFLRADVEPLFEHLQDYGPTVADAIDAYRAAIDPRVGTVYDQRRRFEESVTRLTEAISTYLGLEEQAAQAMVPHYFEKQQADGVDYQIYAGKSLLENGRCDPLCLKNLRIWQLMVACGIALRADRLRDRLPLPLEVTHLILVQQTPLSIRFRFDEKRFDVDGAYDIRYEIVKKRIDKALVRGSSERLTQPGKIAVVYSHPGEAQEYLGYIEYLQHLGYLANEVEDLELSDLQGMRGLRALRVTVNLANPRVEHPVTPATVAAAPGGPSER
jgi:GAF domain-containing protein